MTPSATATATATRESWPVSVCGVCVPYGGSHHTHTTATGRTRSRSVALVAVGVSGFAKRHANVQARNPALFGQPASAQSPTVVTEGCNKASMGVTPAGVYRVVNVDQRAGIGGTEAVAAAAIGGRASVRNHVAAWAFPGVPTCANLPRARGARAEPACFQRFSAVLATGTQPVPVAAALPGFLSAASARWGELGAGRHRVGSGRPRSRVRRVALPLAIGLSHVTTLEPMTTHWSAT